MKKEGAVLVKRLSEDLCMIAEASALPIRQIQLHFPLSPRIVMITVRITSADKPQS
jgi:hypothetical protein